MQTAPMTMAVSRNPRELLPSMRLPPLSSAPNSLSSGRQATAPMPEPMQPPKLRYTLMERRSASRLVARPPMLL